MFFRNLMLFRFPALDLTALEERLAECQLKPVGHSEMMSRGWVSPFGSDSPLLVHEQYPYKRITLGGEDRILPTAVVQKEFDRRLKIMEAERGRKAQSRARKLLKEDIVMELLPKALVQGYRLDAHLDPAQGFLAVNTSSNKQAENLVSELRHALGSFPAQHVNAETSVRGLLTGWLAGEALPEGLALGDEAELQDPVDGGAKVRCSRHELLTDEIRHHLEAGKQVTRLGLVLDDHVSFVLGEDLVVRKLKFLDGALEPLEDTESDGVAAELDARYAIMAGEVGALFSLLEDTFKITSLDTDPEDLA